jgi:hypothetical protein
MLGDDVNPALSVRRSHVLLDECSERALKVLRGRKRDQQHAHELPALEGALAKNSMSVRGHIGGTETGTVQGSMRNRRTCWGSRSAAS